VLLAAGALLFRWLGLIPRSVLSAVIMVIAIQHFDLWSLRLLRGLGHGSPAYRINVAVDLAVVVTVAVLSIALNIVSAVFIGVAIAVGLFVLRMSRSIVRRSYRCSTIHSRTSRTASERAYLDRAGEAVLVLELQGALFFGTGERMLSEVDLALQTETSCVILDLRRLTEIDSTGATALLELKTRLAQQKKQFLLALAEHTPAMERLENFGVVSAIGPVDFVADVDRAIERAEDQLLREHLPLYRGEIALADVGLLADFDPGERAAVEHHLRRVAHRPDEVVFREGDPGNELFVLTKGTASAYLELPKGNIRLATFSPGTIFGELALLDAGVRSATVIADDDIICYALSTADFAAMAATSPNVAIRLLAAIGRELSGRLRTANRTIHQLET
jgi:CRP-like cAMP-binding protein/anti-anti-sigma regulatory factor